MAQFHIEYAMNYEKLKDIEKCNYHCEEAVKLFHFGTYSYKRLIINYVKAKDWGNALRVIDMVFKNEAVFDHRKFFKDKPSQWEELSSYALKRKEFILKKLKEEEQKETKYCEHCGKEIDDKEVFCKHCGEKQKEDKKSEPSKNELLEEVKKLRQETEQQNRKKNQNSAYNSMMVIGAILVLVCIYLWKCSGIF